MPGNCLNIFYHLLCISIFVDFISEASDLPSMGFQQPSANKSGKKVQLPPCKICSVLTESFLKGIDETARNKHDGGDAAWEEERLGSYKRSEIRLVEIQESLCKDSERSEDQCHGLAESSEELIEEWWFKRQDEYPDLHEWLCIGKLQVCCPAGHFGADCTPCTDCQGNGKCKGDGTRKGNGKCSCNKGYSGESCNDCSVGFYESFRDSSKLLCSECHTSCGDGGCTMAGPSGCRICKRGWRMEPEAGGCSDIDECVSTKVPCERNQFCVNTEGSYRCLDCDKSCDGCNGDGPDLCDKCADGFGLRDGLCKEKEVMLDDTTEHSGDSEVSRPEIPDKEL